MSLHELIIAAQNFKRFIFLERSDCGLDAFSTLVFEFLYFISFIEVFSFNTNVSLDLLANRNSNWVFTTRFCQVNQFIEESIVVWSWFNLESLFTVEDVLYLRLSWCESTSLVAKYVIYSCKVFEHIHVLNLCVLYWAFFDTFFLIEQLGIFFQYPLVKHSN